MPLGLELRDRAWERNWLKELLLVSELVKLVLDEPVVDTVVEGLGLTELVWLWVEEGELLEVIVSDGVGVEVLDEDEVLERLPVMESLRLGDWLTELLRLELALVDWLGVMEPL